MIACNLGTFDRCASCVECRVGPSKPDLTQGAVILICGALSWGCNDLYSWCGQVAWLRWGKSYSHIPQIHVWLVTIHHNCVAVQRTSSESTVTRSTCDNSPQLCCYTVHLQRVYSVWSSECVVWQLQCQNGTLSTDYRPAMSIPLLVNIVPEGTLRKVMLLAAYACAYI